MPPGLRGQFGICSFLSKRFEYISLLDYPRVVFRLSTSSALTSNALAALDYLRFLD